MKTVTQRQFTHDRDNRTLSERDQYVVVLYARPEPVGNDQRGTVARPRAKTGEPLMHANRRQ